MTYIEKLQTDNWKIKRESIIERDNYTCQICGKPGYDSSFVMTGITKGDNKIDFDEHIVFPNIAYLELNVHHICYRKGKEPWEYSDKELVTLCPECHKEIHEEYKVPILNESGKVIENTIKCEKCQGYGYIPQYSHIQSGICFDCWGEGIVLEVLDKI